MGIFDRLKKKKETSPVDEATVRKVTVNFPSYFKAGEGEYRFSVDGEERVCKPFSKTEFSVPFGTHAFRVYSTPETLSDVSCEMEITEDTELSVTVNVKDGILAINVNDRLRSHKDFEEKFRQENHIR